MLRTFRHFHIAKLRLLEEALLCNLIWATYSRSFYRSCKVGVAGVHAVLAPLSPFDSWFPAAGYEIADGRGPPTYPRCIWLVSSLKQGVPSESVLRSGCVTEDESITPLSLTCNFHWSNRQSRNFRARSQSQSFCR